MHEFLIYTIVGVVTGSIYAISASGLVVTYVTSRVFNFAHGAIGMLVAFIYYALRVTLQWPEGWALAVSLLVIAPAIGLLLDVAIMRRLQRVAVAIRLMATLALFLFVVGLVVLLWGSQLRSLPTLFPFGGFSPVSGVNVEWDQLAIVVAAFGVLVGMEVFFKRTRLGTTMRAVVDNRTLGEMHGINASRITGLSWALGCSLAGLAAILIAPTLTLNIPALSLLVVSSYAAAIVGRLSSLGWTLVGALGLGLLTSYATGYLPTGNQLASQIGPAMPFIVLLIALVVLRAEPGSRFEKLDLPPEPKPITLRKSLIVGGAIVAAIAIASPFLSNVVALIVGGGLSYALILLSLVLITGMSGQISIAQMSFVGMAAVLMPHFTHYMPWIVAVPVCVVVTAAVGVLVAIPALRLRGLYLALSTLAFAVMMDNVFFPDTHLIPPLQGAIAVPPPSFAGLTLSSPKSQLWLLALVVALYMIGIYTFRRRRFGHALSALRDAPVAASALGLNITRTKLTVFAISAGMAGLAGCLYGGFIGSVSGNQFSYQTSLAALLILAIYGMGSVPGAIIGAIFYVLSYELIPLWVHNATVVTAIQPFLIALGVLNLAIHPEGVIAQNREQFGKRRKEKARAATLTQPQHLDDAIKSQVGALSAVSTASSSTQS
jgi:branched-chain amino acid transport system permease protein